MIAPKTLPEEAKTEKTILLEKDNSPTKNSFFNSIVMSKKNKSKKILLIKSMITNFWLAKLNTTELKNLK